MKSGSCAVVSSWLMHWRIYGGWFTFTHLDLGIGSIIKQIYCVLILKEFVLLWVLWRGPSWQVLHADLSSHDEESEQPPFRETDAHESSRLTDSAYSRRFSKKCTAKRGCQKRATEHAPKVHQGRKKWAVEVPIALEKR